MKLIYFKNIIIFFILISSSFAYSIDRPEIKNLIIHKDKKKIENLEFIESESQKITLETFKSKSLIINFWATWCAPCKKEMPSLDRLKENPVFKNINVVPINIGGDSYEKSKKFFEDLNIKNLNIYSADGSKISKSVKLRGLPTTLLIDKNGFELARILGYIDFEDKNLLKWIEQNL